MKFKLTRETLLKPLQQVTSVVEKRQTLPILSNVLVKAEGNRIVMTGTDLEVEMVVSLEAAIEDGGESTLPARKLLDICRNLPEGAEISFSLSGERMSVTSGKSRFQLATLPAGDYPALDELVKNHEFTLAEDVLKRVIEKTQFSMAQQDVRYYLNGLMVEMNPGKLRAVATDGHRLAVCEADVALTISEPQQIIIPRKGVGEMGRLLEESENPITVQVGANHIRLIKGDVCLTSKLVDGRFPDYQRVIPKNGDKVVVIDKETFRQALVRASILSNEKYRGIRFQLESGLVRISAHNPDQEEAEEEIMADFDGDSMEIGFNATYVQESLAALDVDEVVMTLLDANSSCLVEGKGQADCRYVVMPMRL